MYRALLLETPVGNTVRNDSEGPQLDRGPETCQTYIFTESELLLSCSSSALTTYFNNLLDLILASIQTATEIISTVAYMFKQGMCLVSHSSSLFGPQNQGLWFRSSFCHSHRLLLLPGAPSSLKHYHIFYWQTIFSPSPRPWYITVRISPSAEKWFLHSLW